MAMLAAAPMALGRAGFDQPRRAAPQAVPRFGLGLALPRPGVQPSLQAPRQRPTVEAQAVFGWGKDISTIDPEDPTQVALRSTAGAQKNLSFVAFWLQLALTLASAGVLLFSLAFSPAAPGAAGWSKYLTAVGVVFAFISTFFAHGFLNLSRSLQMGNVVRPSWINTNLLLNNTMNLVGIGATVVGLQASVGTLVAKTLFTSAQTAYAQPQNAVVSFDVFALQAATNTLLSHVISLLFTNLMIRLVSGAVAKATEPPPSPAARPITLGVNPWEKAD